MAKKARRRRAEFELGEVPSDELINEIRKRNEAVIGIVWNPGNVDDGPMNVFVGFNAAASAADKLDIVQMMFEGVQAEIEREIRIGEV